MCDCIKRVEKQLTEKMIEMYPGFEVVQKVEFQNITMLMDNQKDNVRPFNPVLGKVKKGGVTRKFDTSMIYTFCPFCGIKYE